MFCALIYIELENLLATAQKEFPWYFLYAVWIGLYLLHSDSSLMIYNEFQPNHQSQNICPYWFCSLQNTQVFNYTIFPLSNTLRQNTFPRCYVTRSVFPMSLELCCYSGSITALVSLSVSPLFAFSDFLKLYYNFILWLSCKNLVQHLYLFFLP